MELMRLGGAIYKAAAEEADGEASRLVQMGERARARSVPLGTCDKFDEEGREALDTTFSPYA